MIDGVNEATIIRMLEQRAAHDEPVAAAMLARYRIGDITPLELAMIWVTVLYAVIRATPTTIPADFFTLDGVTPNPLAVVQNAEIIVNSDCSSAQFQALIAAFPGRRISVTGRCEFSAAHPKSS